MLNMWAYMASASVASWNAAIWRFLRETIRWNVGTLWAWYLVMVKRCLTSLRRLACTVHFTSPIRWSDGTNFLRFAAPRTAANVCDAWHGFSIFVLVWRFSLFFLVSKFQGKINPSLTLLFDSIWFGSTANDCFILGKSSPATAVSARHVGLWPWAARLLQGGVIWNRELLEVLQHEIPVGRVWQWHANTSSDLLTLCASGIFSISLAMNGFFCIVCVCIRRPCVCLVCAGRGEDCQGGIGVWNNPGSRCLAWSRHGTCALFPRLGGQVSLRRKCKQHAKHTLKNMQNYKHLVLDFGSEFFLKKIGWHHWHQWGRDRLEDAERFLKERSSTWSKEARRQKDQKARW